MESNGEVLLSSRPVESQSQMLIERIVLRLKFEREMVQRRSRNFDERFQAVDSFLNLSASEI
jgi:hypothetical protein